MNVYLDMDEVLSDFILSACEAHEVDVDEMNSNREPGDWCIVPAIAKVLGFTNQQFTNVDFWQPINAQGIEFWSNMAETDYFTTVIRSLQKLNINYYILSNPGLSIEAHTGKAIWLKERLGYQFDRFILTPYKDKLANSNSLLIDDSEDNCRAFTKAGGKSLLFPSFGNRLHKHRNTPWDYVESSLRELL